MKIANAFKQIIRFGLTRSQEQKDSLTIKTLADVDALEATYYAQSPGSLAEAGARLLRVAAKLQKKSASPEIKELGLNLAERVRNKDSSSYDEAHALAVVHYTAKLESQKNALTGIAMGVIFTSSIRAWRLIPLALTGVSFSGLFKSRHAGARIETLQKFKEASATPNSKPVAYLGENQDPQKPALLVEAQRLDTEGKELLDKDSSEATQEETKKELQKAQSLFKQAHDLLSSVPLLEKPWLNQKQADGSHGRISPLWHSECFNQKALAEHHYASAALRLGNAAECKGVGRTIDSDFGVSRKV